MLTARWWWCALSATACVVGVLTSAQETKQCEADNTDGCTTTESGVITSGAIGEEKSQVDYYQKASHYDKIWGEDNLHLGFFPHLERGATTKIALNHRQAATALTEKMLAAAGVRNGTTVVDLGAGKGRACYDIATQTGASCLGMDLTPANVERGNAIAAAHPELNLEFVVGSFTDLPDEVVNKAPFDVVFSQVAFCHVHAMLGTIFEQAKRVMGPDSILIVNDYLGPDGEVTEDTKEHVFKRLHFETLLGPVAWRSKADAAGLVLHDYYTLDAHMALAYEEMASEAAALGVVSTDQTPLATHYTKSAEAARDRQIGMNLALYTL